MNFPPRLNLLPQSLPAGYGSGAPGTVARDAGSLTGVQPQTPGTFADALRAALAANAVSEIQEGAVFHSLESVPAPSVLLQAGRTPWPVLGPSEDAALAARLLAGPGAAPLIEAPAPAAPNTTPASPASEPASNGTTDWITSAAEKEAAPPSEESPPREGPTGGAALESVSQEAQHFGSTATLQAPNAPPRERASPREVEAVKTLQQAQPWSGNGGPGSSSSERPGSRPSDRSQRT